MKELKWPHCHTLFTVNESDYSQILAQVRGQEFDKELAQRLESEMKLQEARANSRFQEVLTKKEQAIQSLTNRLERIEQEQAYLRQQELAQKDKELLELHNQLDKLELEQQSRLQSALTVVEKERDHLKNQLVLQEKESELSLASVRSDYEVQLKAVNEQVEFYKNFKAQQSTKAIGESLELYAETEFNKVRSYAFPNASFTKDNQVSHRGSKGDYIYRELDSNGVEILSIMFEMKNEADTTKTKHKNSDFFKELDKDRREKNCEYAVLVTMLEADNDYYNAGIVDVSHDYDKMYVVRPQLFIHLIGLLRNAALNSLKYKQELALVREQHIDITHFEEDLEQFKHAFAKNYQSASNNFKKAIDEIDKSIKRMEEVKRFLTTSENQLRLANNKLDDVSVKKLTRNNPTMRDKFQAIKS